jgi:hypothetical protein
MKSMKKHKLMLTKSLSAIALLFACQAGMAQTVLNGGFEAGPGLCTGGNNGPFYLGDGWASNWTGYNSGSSVGNNPFNSGSVQDDTAPCLFGQFSPGIVPGEGHRSITIYQKRGFGNFLDDVTAYGSFNGPLQEQTYYVCVRLMKEVASTANCTVQVIVYSSTSIQPEIVAGEFTIPTALTAWRNYSSFFKVPRGTGGFYDKVKLQLKRNWAPEDPKDYRNLVYIDNLSIEPGIFAPSCVSAGITKGQPVSSLDQLQAESATMKIAPNPAYEKLEVILHDNYDLKNTVVTIVDIQGKLIQTIKNPSNSRFNIDISSLPAGMYFINAASGATTTVLKFIRQ